MSVAMRGVVMLERSLRQHIDLNQELRPYEARNQKRCHGRTYPGPPFESLLIQRWEILAPDHVVGQSQNIGHRHLTCPKDRLDVFDRLPTLGREIGGDRSVGTHADLACHMYLSDGPEFSLHRV